MIKELEASEIIAFCLKQKRQSRTVELQYNTIRSIARRMEEKIPSLLVTYDMLSIDAFRCEFSKYVIMKEHAIRINRVHEIYGRIQRYLPDEMLELKLQEVEIELEER